MNCAPANNHLLVVPSNPGTLWYIYPYLHAYLEEVDKYKFQYFIFHETATPYSLKTEVMFRKNCACKSSKVNCAFKATFFFSYLSIFWAYLDVSNSYKFKLVFHVSQDFSWHMNFVCNSPFVNCFFKSFLLYIYHNLKEYILFGRNR